MLPFINGMDTGLTFFSSYSFDRTLNNQNHVKYTKPSALGLCHCKYALFNIYNKSYLKQNTSPSLYRYCYHEQNSICKHTWKEHRSNGFTHLSCQIYIWTKSHNSVFLFSSFIIWNFQIGVLIDEVIPYHTLICQTSNKIQYGKDQIQDF